VAPLLTDPAWTSLALPALKLLLPKLRDSSVVIADKTNNAKIMYPLPAEMIPGFVLLNRRFRYKDLLDFVRRPDSGFMSITIPFSEGFEVMVYKPG
jgi:hypothetical protein